MNVRGWGSSTMPQIRRGLRSTPGSWLDARSKQSFNYYGDMPEQCCWQPQVYQLSTEGSAAQTVILGRSTLFYKNKG